MEKKHSMGDIIKYLSLMVMMFIILSPIYLIILTAFKEGNELSSSVPYALPKSFLHMDNFVKVLANGVILKGYLNTAFILVISLAGNIILGTCAAYALARFEFRLKKIIMGLYVASIIIPTTTTQVATFGIIKSLHLMNTPFSVILLYLGTDIIQLYLYIQFIKSIPYAMDEAAIVEGAGYFRVYRKIILPMVVPAIVTIIILKTVSIYNDVYLPYIYMPSQKLVVVSTALMRFTSSSATDYKLVSAATIFVILPTILLYLFLQKYIFAGIASGAVKG